MPFKYSANKKAWMNTNLWIQWLRERFVPEVKKYIKQLGIPAKVSWSSQRQA